MTRLRHLTFFATLVLALAVTVGSAQGDPLNDFEITPTALGGDAAPVTADKIVGGYGETFTVTSSDGMGGGTFIVDAFWVAGQFFADDGLTPLAAFQTDLGNDYIIYGLFTATGTFSTDAITGEVEFVATGGSIELWADFISPLTTFALPADASTGDVAVGGTGDPDQLLATAPVFFGEGNADPNDLASGNFEIIFQPFSLTALGASYFTDPVPFYMIVNVAGQFNFFEPSGSVQLNGSADAFFAPAAAVPEPASMTLLGMGLLGSGLMARRRRRTA